MNQEATDYFIKVSIAMQDATLELLKQQVSLRTYTAMVNQGNRSVTGVLDNIKLYVIELEDRWKRLLADWDRAKGKMLAEKAKINEQNIKSIASAIHDIQHIGETGYKPVVSLSLIEILQPSITIKWKPDENNGCIELHGNFRLDDLEALTVILKEHLSSWMRTLSEENNL